MMVKMTHTKEMMTVEADGITLLMGVHTAMDCDILVLTVLAHNALAPTRMPTDAPTTTMNDKTTLTICP